MSSQDYDSKYRALIEPIRDLAQNWNIDISSNLEEYLRELEDIRIHIEGDEYKLNFAEAALLIQGSTAIYCKKIDHLHNLVYKTLEVIAQKNRADIKNKCNTDLEADSKNDKQKDKSDLSLWNDDDPSYIMYDNEFELQKNINICKTPQDLHFSDDVNMKCHSSSSTMLLFALLQDDQKQNTLKLSSSNIHPLFGILEIGLISKVDVSHLSIPSSFKCNTIVHKYLNDNNNSILNIHNNNNNAINNDNDNNNKKLFDNQQCKLFQNSDDDDDDDNNNNDYEGFDNMNPFEEKIGNTLLATPTKDPLSEIGPSLSPPLLSSPIPLVAPSSLVEHTPAFLPPLSQPVDDNILQQSNNEIDMSIVNDNNNINSNNNTLITPKKTTPRGKTTPNVPPQNPHISLHQTKPTHYNSLALLDPHQPSNDSRALKVMKSNISSFTKSTGKPPLQKQRLSEVISLLDSPELPLDGLVYKHLEYWINTTQNKVIAKKGSIRGKHSDEAMTGTTTTTSIDRDRNHQKNILNTNNRDGVVSSSSHLSSSSTPSLPNEMYDNNIDLIQEVDNNYDDGNSDCDDADPLPPLDDHNGSQLIINNIQNYGHPDNVVVNESNKINDKGMFLPVHQYHHNLLLSPNKNDHFEVDTYRNNNYNSNGNSNSSYEAICRKHIERFMLSAEAFARESSLAGRVKEWTRRLEPQLQEQDHRPTFDMHIYSARFLNKVVEVNNNKNRNILSLQNGSSSQPTLLLKKSNKQQNKKDECIDFSLLVDCHEKHQYEVCRMFLACLQLANFGNVKIIKNSTDSDAYAAGIGTFSVGLVSDILNTDIDNFSTLSISK